MAGANLPRARLSARKALLKKAFSHLVIQIVEWI
jgi:hypothetical protein